LRTEARDRGFDLYELVVEFVAGSVRENLESAVAQLRGELVALNLYCHRDTNPDGKGRSVRLLVAPNKAISQELVRRYIHASVGITNANSHIRSWKCQKLGPVAP